MPYWIPWASNNLPCPWVYKIECITTLNFPLEIGVGHSDWYSNPFSTCWLSKKSQKWPGQSHYIFQCNKTVTVFFSGTVPPLGTKSPNPLNSRIHKSDKRHYYLHPWIPRPMCSERNYYILTAGIRHIPQTQHLKLTTCCFSADTVTAFAKGHYIVFMMATTSEWWGTWKDHKVSLLKFFHHEISSLEAMCEIPWKWIKYPWMVGLAETL